jgi:hypothetical protein
MNKAMNSLANTTCSVKNRMKLKGFQKKQDARKDGRSIWRQLAKIWRQLATASPPAGRKKNSKRKIDGTGIPVLI